MKVRTLLRAGRLALVPILAWAVEARADVDPEVGTPAQRRALYRELVAKTLERQAFSPPKLARLKLDFARDAAPLEEVFAQARGGAELLRALLRLSNLRWDGHLEVQPVRGGLQHAPGRTQRAPIRFAVDYARPGDWRIFVTEVSPPVGVADPPEVGDEVVAVNGEPIAAYLRRLEPWVAASTPERLWLELAVNLSHRRVDFDPALYRDDVRFALRKPDGRRIEVTLPYADAGLVEPPHEDPLGFLFAATRREKRYPGFRQRLETSSFRLHVSQLPGERLVLLDWISFKKGVREDLARLVAEAREAGLLDHDVICDLTTSRGGKGAWALLQHLSSRPFRVTSSNLRLSDVAPQLAAQLEDKALRKGDTRLADWVSGDLIPALARGEPYTDPVPFKLRALARDSDGVLPPAETHFRGRLVVLLGPQGRSQVDQLAAMVVDNGLGHSIGMPTAGTSNSWEWYETLYLPGTDRPLAEFMWSVGQTLRPNGEVLEGHPAQPAEPLPITRESHADYYALALERARSWLRSQPRDVKAEAPAVDP